MQQHIQIGPELTESGSDQMIFHDTVNEFDFDESLQCGVPEAEDEDGDDVIRPDQISFDNVNELDCSESLQCGIPEDSDCEIEPDQISFDGSSNYEPNANFSTIENEPDYDSDSEDDDISINVNVSNNFLCDKHFD